MISACTSMHHGISSAPTHSQTSLAPAHSAASPWSRAATHPQQYHCVLQQAGLRPENSAQSPGREVDTVAQRPSSATVLTEKGSTMYMNKGLREHTFSLPSTWVRYKRLGHQLPQGLTGLGHHLRWDDSLVHSVHHLHGRPGLCEGKPDGRKHVKTLSTCILPCH